MEVRPGDFVEMNGSDMASLGLEEGDLIKITGAGGQAFNAKVKESRRAVRWTVLVPYHFSNMKSNSLTDWGSTEILIQVEKA